MNKNKSMDELPPISDSSTSPKKKWGGFLFLPSFREVYKCMVSLGQQDKANLYLEALMVYGTEGRIITDDDFVTMGLIPAMRTIDAKKAEWEKKASRNKKK